MRGDKVESLRIRVTEQQRKEIQRAAEKARRSESEFIRLALEDYVAGDCGDRRQAA